MQDSCKRWSSKLLPRADLRPIALLSHHGPEGSSLTRSQAPNSYVASSAAFPCMHSPCTAKQGARQPHPSVGSGDFDEEVYLPQVWQTSVHAHRLLLLDMQRTGSRMHRSLHSARRCKPLQRLQHARACRSPHSPSSYRRPGAGSAASRTPRSCAAAAPTPSSAAWYAGLATSARAATADRTRANSRRRTSCARAAPALRAEAGACPDDALQAAQARQPQG